MRTAATAKKKGKWVDVGDRLPEPGREVPVFGAYVNKEGPFPLARRRADDDPDRRTWGTWDSCQWHGMVGINWWWDEQEL